MNLYDAYVILLEATVEKDDDRNIRNARKLVAKKVEALRLKKEREAARKLKLGTMFVDSYAVPVWVEPFPPSN